MYRKEAKRPRHCNAATSCSASRDVLVLLRCHIRRGSRMASGVCVGDEASRDRAVRLRFRGARLPLGLRHGSPPLVAIAVGVCPLAPALCCTMSLHGVLWGLERRNVEIMWITPENTHLPAYDVITSRFRASFARRTTNPPTIHNRIHIASTACRHAPTSAFPSRTDTRDDAIIDTHITKGTRQ